MKITTKQKPLLAVESDKVRLLGITDSGEFHYQISFEADLTEVLKQDAYVVDLKLGHKAYEKEIVPVFQSSDPDSIVSGLLSQRPKTLDLSREFRESFFFEEELDLSSQISKEVLRDFKLSKDLRFKKTELKAVSVSEIKKKNLVLPVIETVLSSGTSMTGMARKQESLRLLSLENKDPAQEIGQSRNLVSSLLGSQGIIPPTPKTNKIVGSFIGQGSSKSTKDMLPQETVMVPVETISKFHEFSFDFFVPFSLLSRDSFYITLFHRGRHLLGVYNLHVSHLYHVDHLEIPSVPPKIGAPTETQTNSVRLSLTQKDDHATQIFLYRKTIQKDVSLQEINWVEVGRFPAVKDEKVLYRDVLPSLSKTLYRAVAVNRNGNMGAEFSSAVVEVPFFSKNKRNAFVSINSNSTTRGIVVELRGMPANVTSWALQKRNLSFNESKFRFVGGFQRNREEESIPLQIEDTDVLAGKTYEYKVLLVYADGAQQLTTTSSTMTFQPASTSTATTLATNVKTQLEGNQLDVSFDIVTEITPTTLDTIKNSLIRQRLTEFFDSIKDDRDKLQALFAYRIDRINLTTGTQETFGVVSTNRFSDLRLGQNLDLLPLQSGHRYEYKISTFLRSAESLIPSVERELEGYSFSPFKWLHPLALTKGTITTAESRRRNFAQNEFTFGELAGVFKVEISLEDFRPVVSKTRAVLLGNDKVSVEWSVNGPSTEVDHFVICSEILDAKTVLGKSHSLGGSGTFHFLDTQTDIRGAITYSVTPVYKDFSIGETQRTNTVLK